MTDFERGHCKHCMAVIRGYYNDKGEIVWSHWDQKRRDHRAEPSELTLRGLYGDR